MLPRGFDTNCKTLDRIKQNDAFGAAYQIYKRGSIGSWKMNSSATKVKKLNSLGDFKEACKGKYLIVDQHFFELWKEQLELPMQNIFLLEATESNKSLESAAKITMTANDLREWIAIGGGITTDVAGFAASMVGAEVSFIPTTLLGAVDAAIGGKTGVNFSGVKNLVGSFWSTLNVLHYSDFFSTLSDYEYFNGGAEALKLLLIQEKLGKAIVFWKTCLARKVDCEKTMLFAKEKQSFIHDDVNEKGKRSLLNFGHTFAHLIEGASQDSDDERSIGHGAAVLIGMYLEVKFVESQQVRVPQKMADLLKEAIVDRAAIDDSFTKDIQQTLNITPTLAMPLLLNDKKSKYRKIGFSNIYNEENHIVCFDPDKVEHFITNQWIKELETLNCKMS